jgi:hypothetical protein
MPANTLYEVRDSVRENQTADELQNVNVPRHFRYSPQGQRLETSEPSTALSCIGFAAIPTLRLRLEASASDGREWTLCDNPCRGQGDAEERPEECGAAAPCLPLNFAPLSVGGANSVAAHAEANDELEAFEVVYAIAANRSYIARAS